MTSVSPTRTVRVLVMEDHDGMRTAMVDAITAAESMTVVAATGSARAAIALAAEHRPDIAVLDVRMPDGNGIDVCRAIRAADPHVRCVVVTSHEDVGTRREVIAAGATSFVLKTMRVQELTRAIADATGELELSTP